MPASNIDFEHFHCARYADGGLFYGSFKVSLFVLIYICLTVNVLILYFGVQETRRTISHPSARRFVAIFQRYQVAYRNRPFVLLLISSMLILSAEMSLSSYVAVRLEHQFKTIQLYDFPIDGVRMFSILLLINTITIISLSFAILHYFKRFKVATILNIGFLFFAGGYTVVMSNNHALVLVIFMLMATIGEILFTPTVEAEKYVLSLPTHAVPIPHWIVGCQLVQNSYHGYF